MLIAMAGKPSSGKSTFFNAATLVGVKTAPYPFTTIKSTEGVGYVTSECPCKELDVKCNPKNSQCINGRRLIPIKLMDVAGLIPGSHEGKGMGNQFLDDIRQASVLLQIIDTSGKTDEKGESSTDYDPSKEVKFLDEEIGMWLFGILKKNWSKLSRQIKLAGKKPEETLSESFSGIGITVKNTVQAVNALNLDLSDLTKWNDDDLKNFAFKIREISKPTIVVANKIDLESSKNNFEKLKKDYPDKIIIPTSAETEFALRNASKNRFIDYFPGDSDFAIKKDLDEKQKNALGFLKKSVLDVYGSSGVQKALNAAVFDLLDCIVVYPVENENHYTSKQNDVLPDAILIKKGSTALELAHKVHTSIGEGFIRAIDARTKKVLGKDYVLKSNDVIKIVKKS